MKSILKYFILSLLVIIRNRSVTYRLPINLTSKHYDDNIECMDHESDASTSRTVHEENGRGLNKRTHTHTHTHTHRLRAK